MQDLYLPSYRATKTIVSFTKLFNQYYLIGVRALIYHMLGVAYTVTYGNRLDL